MKRFVMIIILSLLSFDSLRGSVLIDSKEYKPKGKHYTAKTNKVYHYYSEMASEKIILLYFKTSGGVVIYKGLEVSNRLEKKLPWLVLRYIGLFIADVEMKKTHSVEKVKDVVRRAVQKALDQRYKDLLISEGHKLSQDSSYFRGYCNTKWWGPNYYYDYKPAFSTDTVNTFLTSPVKDARFPGLKYITDTLRNFKRHHDEKSLSQWGNVFRKVRNTKNERTIRDYGFVWSAIANDNDYHTPSDSCRFALKRTNIAHGKRYPVFASVSIFGWHATYCNFFASDLREAVFGDAVWATKGCKKDYDTLKTIVDFVEIKKEDILKYSSIGYYVFLIDEGHIATVYPGDKKYSKNGVDYPEIVQAGASTGTFSVFIPWSNFDTDASVKCYLYLGYLKSNI